MNVEIARMRIDRHTNGLVARVETPIMDGLCIAKKMASIAVRDQARHSSLAITELYTKHLEKANPDVVNWEGSL